VSAAGAVSTHLPTLPTRVGLSTLVIDTKTSVERWMASVEVVRG
jgi:hypothetical protein